MSAEDEEETDRQQLGSSVIDSLLPQRRQSEENGLAARYTCTTAFDGNRRITDGRRASSSSIRRESGTLFHPLSNLIPVPPSDLITTSALPRDDSANTNLGLSIKVLFLYRNLVLSNSLLNANHHYRMNRTSIQSKNLGRMRPAFLNITALSIFLHLSHAGTSAFGRLKYKYTGKHSEGNRFIRNYEL